MTDALLRRAETKHICLMGCGISSAIVLQSAVVDGRADALVLQSPFANLENYLARYAYAKWGRLKPFGTLFSTGKRNNCWAILESHGPAPARQRGENTHPGGDRQRDELVSRPNPPAVFDSSAAPKKTCALIRKAGHQNIDELGGAGITTASPRSW